MSVTRQARRSDALYYDETGTITRRWLCDRIGAVEGFARLLLRHLRDSGATDSDVECRARQLGLED